MSEKEHIAINFSDSSSTKGPGLKTEIERVIEIGEKNVSQKGNDSMC